VLLRDSAGNLEILYMSSTGIASATDLAPSQLSFTATPAFKNNNPTLPTTGKFDTTWKVAGVGRINGYAGIIWVNAVNEVGLTQFIYPSEKPYGNVIATLPAGSVIRGMGDYNGDGSIDLLLWDSSTGVISFWYLGYLGGNYYQPAPATGVELSASWQN
jgi:hypothetical protein